MFVNFDDFLGLILGKVLLVIDKYRLSFCLVIGGCGLGLIYWVCVGVIFFVSFI